MQKRHTDRKMYFHDLEITSKEFYVSYLSNFKKLTSKSRVLEVGCGEGGNLVPFAQLGCRVTGIDIAECRIIDAKAYFSEICENATFVCCDFMKYHAPINEEEKFDVILLHDVIEHVPAKGKFLLHLKSFLKSTGVLFVGFLHGRCRLVDINRFAEANSVRTFRSYICYQTLCIIHY